MVTVTGSEFREPRRCPTEHGALLSGLSGVNLHFRGQRAELICGALRGCGHTLKWYVVVGDLHV
jgi:hypothetical protein